jgi:hypothetical protein
MMNGTLSSSRALPRGGQDEDDANLLSLQGRASWRKQPVAPSWLAVEMTSGPETGF